MDQRGHSRRKLRFRLVMQDNASQSGGEIRCGMIMEIRIFHENPYIRLFQPDLWHKYPCISSKNSCSKNERFCYIFDMTAYVCDVSTYFIKFYSEP